ncbi:MAG: CoA-binding protein [Peptococcaceae bacterium]|nr:CoA-binding protein [Peptococcaceae bacterium]
MTGASLADLHAVFYPERVAVLGVTDTPDRVGYNVLESILGGGFTGEVFPVHPRHRQILGCRVYKSLEEIPGPVDVAVICLNQHATVEAVEKCGRLGVKGVVCHAGGFRETGDEGRALESRLVEAADKYGVRLVGPNSLGLINNDGGFYTIFYPLRLPAGSVSIVSQSGGMGLAVMHKAMDEGMGINKFVGVGYCSRLSFADYLEYLENDASTSVIGVFMEGSDEAGRFARVAGRVARKKPVVVYKAGRAGAAGYCALTHTGSAAGAYRLYRDIFRQHGLFMVESVAELVAACKALALARLPAGNRVGILTHTAGPSIVMVDRLEPSGAVIPPLQEETIRQVKRVIGEDPPVVLKNPLDAAGLGFSRPVYGRLAETMLADGNIDLLLAVYCLHKNWGLPSNELVRAHSLFAKPVLACYLADLPGCREDRAILQAAGVPLYTTPEEAAAAAAALVHYGSRIAL